MPGAVLVIEIDGKRYELGKAPELKTEGNRWILTLSSLPSDGIHDVIAIVRADGREKRDPTTGELVVDATPPAAPALTGIAHEKGQWRLSGTWPEGDAKGLVVKVDDRTYELGRSGELSSDGEGHWQIALPEKELKEGPHDVAIIVADAAGNRTTKEWPKAFIVDTTPPAQPTLEEAVRDGNHWRLAGSWPEGDAKDLVVKVDDRTFVLGRDAELSSDGKGHWRLVLPEKALMEGPHDVTVTAVDAAGNVAEKSWPKAFTVDTTPPPKPAFTALVTNDPHAVISGTWPSDEARRLVVELDGTAHELGKSPNLKVAGDRWVLTTDAPLKPGRHMLKMRVADAAGNASESTASFEVAAADRTPPSAPTIDALLANNPRAVISGTWPGEEEAKRLEVELDGRKFVLGETDALKAEDRVWKLYPPEPLAEGEHRVVARAIDASGNAAKTERVIVIDTTPPQVPEVAAVTVKSGEKPVLSGALPADVAAMKMTVNGRTWQLGAENSPLVKSDGGWKLTLPEALPEGRHDVSVEVSDEAGNTAQKTFAGAIFVLPAREAEPQPAPQPVADVEKCQRDINTFLKDHHVRFRTDSDLLTSEGMQVVAQLANLVRKCPGLHFHIVGHTDNRGSFQYNRELSARRARTVKNALVGAGIAADRITTEGAGPSFPIASNATEEGRALNRRIEVKVLKPE